jgi:hypothetical protein
MTELEPVVVSVEVALEPDEAFTHFTEQMDAWWPTDRHSIGEDQVEAVVVEAGQGGRIFERWGDGTTKDWADILEWDPPSRFRMAWHPNETGLSTDVEVTFSPTESGTRIELTHYGWESLGDDAVRARESYASGWIGVLELYRKAA